MRKLVLVLSAAAAVGFALPVVTAAQAEEAKVVIKSGHHRHHSDRGHRKVVAIVSGGNIDLTRFARLAGACE